MAVTRVKGFNIILKLNDKKVVGTTSNSLGIKPKLKESLIKDDLGTSQSEHVGYDTCSVVRLVSSVSAGAVSHS